MQNKEEIVGFLKGQNNDNSLFTTSLAIFVHYSVVIGISFIFIYLCIIGPFITCLDDKNKLGLFFFNLAHAFY